MFTLNVGLFGEFWTLQSIRVWFYIGKVNMIIYILTKTMDKPRD